MYQYILFCCLCLGLLAQQLPAQTVHYEQFGLKNQLPSQQINCLHQDRLGRLWIGTAAGLVRYDSYQFSPIAGGAAWQGQPIQRIYEDINGRIWTLGERGKIGWVLNDSLQQPAKTQQVENIAQNRQLAALELDIDGNLYFSLSNQPPYMSDWGIYKIDKSGQLSSQQRNEQAGILLHKKSILSQPSVFLLGQQLSAAPQPLQLQAQADFIQLGNQAQNCRCVIEPQTRVYTCINEKYWLQFDHTGQIFARDSFANPLPTLEDLSLDKQKNIWAATKEGAFCWANGQLKKSATVYFPQFWVKQLLQDREGNYWLATQDEGLLFIPYLHLRLLLVSAHPYQNHIRKLLDINGQVQALSSVGLVYKLSSSTVIPTYYNQTATPALGWFYLPSKQQIFLGNTVCLDANTGTAFVNWWSNQSYQAESFAQLPNGELLVGNRFGFLRFDINKKAPVWNSQAEDFYQPINGFGVENNLCWVASPAGLYRYDWAQNQISKENISLLGKSGVFSVQFDQNQQPILSTQSAGLLYQKNGQWRQLSRKQGLCSDEVRKVLVQNDSIWWAATYNGLDKISWAADGQSAAINHYSVYNGLPTNGINDIIQTQDGRIWLATEAGAVYFEPNQLVQQLSAPPLTSIHKISINGRDSSLQSSYQLEYWQQNVSISFGAVRFRNAGNINYRYRLEGKDSDWQYSHSREIQYTNLGAGSYTFWVSAQGENGSWDGQAAQVVFQISPPWWAAWWFSLSVLLVIGLLLYWYIRQLKKRGALQQKVWASEQNALRAQMNPHFIFNAMNSILYFVRMNDKRQATSFLASFSSLIRRILDNSRQPLISLKDEVETMQKYLELEKLRLSNPSDSFEIEVAEGLDPEGWKLPPMLVQPLLENAIMHGLAPKTEGERRLLLRFEEDKKLLKITVQDNGIGRAAATEIQRRRSSNHSSYGTKNIDERIKLLNQIYKKRIQIQIEDLQAPTGTKISLWIPNFGA